MDAAQPQEVLFGKTEVVVTTQSMQEITIYEREAVATENNKAVLHYPGGEFELDIIKATEGNDGVVLGNMLAIQAMSLLVLLNPKLPTLMATRAFCVTAATILLTSRKTLPSMRFPTF